MNINDKELSRIIGAIKKSRSFFIAGHTKPDGDTIGASIALASLLKRNGKNADIYSKDEVPYYLRYLKGSEKIKVAEKVQKKYDCAVILECSSLGRMGNLITDDQADIIINIDHHRVFEHFGDINYIDPKASSSAEQIYRLFKKMGKKIKTDEAEALYTGVVSDTGKFQFSNTTPFCMCMAADLIKSGVRPEKIFNNLYEGNKLSYLHIMGKALGTLALNPQKDIACMEITNAMFKSAGADYSETENIINYGMSIVGVKISVLLRETEKAGHIKASLRSRGNIDVSKVAKHFGGGGHRNAAGCSLKGSLGEAKNDILKYITGFLNG